MRAREEAVSRLTGPSFASRTLYRADGIQVDFGSLYQFAMTLRILASELGNRNGTLTDGVADPDLAAAFCSAERDWSGQRRRLGAFLDGAANSVEAGLAGYRELEAELAAAAAVPAAR
jgi:hypothetical protein